MTEASASVGLLLATALVSFPVQKHFYPYSNAEYLIIKLKHFLIVFNVPFVYYYSRSQK